MMESDLKLRLIAPGLAPDELIQRKRTPAFRAPCSAQAGEIVTAGWAAQRGFIAVRAPGTLGGAVAPDKYGQRQPCENGHANENEDAKFRVDKACREPGDCSQNRSHDAGQKRE